MTLIADDLLVLSAVESQKVAEQEVDLAEAVRYAAHQSEEQANSRSLRMSVETPDSLTVIGDRTQLIQVLMNLLSNAIRYTPEGTVEIKLARQNGNAICKVRDTGIGIPAEHLPRIFERFYRVDKMRSRETGGTGLGLSIVRHIVEAHGGKVEVESEVGVGTCFSVTLPATP